MNTFHYASTTDKNMLYLVQMRISDPFFFLKTDHGQYVFLSSVDIGAFNENHPEGEIQAVAVEPFRKKAGTMQGDTLCNTARVILEEYQVTGEVVVPAEFPVFLADALRSVSFDLCVSSPWLSDRMKKNSAEVAAIEENFTSVTQAYRLLEQILHESSIKKDTLLYKGEVLTSGYLKKALSKQLLDFDLENSAGIIISCGVHSAMPHHAGKGPIRPHQTIIADIFPQSSRNHYFADMTRTYVKGTAHEDIVRMYEAVQKAHAASLEAVSPGKSCKELYEISAQVIHDAGFDVGEKGYIHSLGHGLGIDVHEAPTVGPNSTHVLEAGNVITIEPGLYYPKRGGVRIEDAIVVTDSGYKNLTNYPQNWLID